MITIKIEVRGHENEVLSEAEREIEYDIVNDKYGKGPFISMIHPDDDLVYKVINDAEDALYQSPEKWANGGHVDYQTQD